ncbi:MAG: exodeoxyribonuclease VII small subunit [Alphaproteobacteria bacterium]
MTSPKALEKLSFEDALEELESIVRKLETGESPLEDSISAYERGTALKRHCEEKLKDAQVKIEKISIAENGTINTQPLDREE